jgi:hypothetical protein
MIEMTSGASNDKRSSFKPPRPKDEHALVKRRRWARRATMRFALRRAFAIMAFGRKSYQPVQIGGRSEASTREFEERWTAVRRVLEEYQARNLLDIGSAEGVLVRRAAAELGCFAIGVEGTDRLVLGELARLHDDVERTSVVRAMLTAADIMRLPRFDIVTCLSVVHHVIRLHGMEGGRDFLRALAARTERAIIFEMGTSEEKAGGWRSGLPDMPEGQDAFVRNLLESCGLVNVRMISETVGYHGMSRRLFCAEPGPTRAGAAV